MSRMIWYWIWGTSSLKKVKREGKSVIWPNWFYWQSIKVLSTPPSSMLSHGRPLFVALTIGSAWEQGLHFMLYPWEVTMTQWAQNFDELCKFYFFAFCNLTRYFPFLFCFSTNLKIHISWNRRYITFRIQHKNAFGSIMNILTTFGDLLLNTWTENEYPV